MRLPACCLLLFLLAGCGYEHKIARRLKNPQYESQLRAVASQLFEQYSHTPNGMFPLLVTDTLDKKYISLLNELKLPSVQVRYINKSVGPVVIDSAVVFSQPGLPFTVEHNVVIDFKTVPRKEFDSCTTCDKVKKLKERIYYVETPYPVM